MPKTLFAQLTEAIRAKDPQATRGLLERAAKQSADVLAAGDRQQLSEFCGSLALVALDTEGFALSAELRELRGYLSALVQLTRAALDRSAGLVSNMHIQRQHHRADVATDAAKSTRLERAGRSTPG